MHRPQKPRRSPATSSGHERTTSWGSKLPELLARSAGILVVGVALGFGFNALRAGGVVLKRYQPAVSCGESEATDAVAVVSAAEAAQLCGSGTVIVADAREASAYREGHVVGAIHLPCTAHAHDADRFASTLTHAEVLIVYGESTQAALDVAQSFQARPLAKDLRIVVVDGGFAAWRDAGFACASGSCSECKEVANHVSSHR